jgi:FixJ family two-component response regulator
MDGTTIGLIDDDLAVRRGLTHLLEACGYRVDAYESGTEFLRRGALETIDCLLLDVRLRELTGFDVRDRLRRRGCTVPIIFITGHCDARIGENRVFREPTTILVKPFDEDVLLAAIHHALQKGGRSMAPAV